MTREVIYSVSAQARQKQLLDEIVKRLDDEITKRKFVPGDEVIEVTASDIDALARSMQLFFHDRYDQRRRTRSILLNVYAFFGVAILAVGLFYNQLRALLNEPTRALLMGSGLGIVLIAFWLRYLVAAQGGMRRRHELIARERELMEELKKRRSE